MRKGPTLLILTQAESSASKTMTLLVSSAAQSRHGVGNCPV
jgi:hypothetical protein